MAYSTIAELRANCANLTIAVISDAEVTSRIVVADNTVETDLSNIVNFTLIPPIPDYINLLSQYKTAELCLVYAYSAKRLKDSFSDIEYWMNKYDNLIAAILSGTIALGTPGLSTMTFDNAHRKDITPALGHGEYGEFANDDTIKAQREEFGGDDEL